jgi:hypothetical protein
VHGSSYKVIKLHRAYRYSVVQVGIEATADHHRKIVFSHNRIAFLRCRYVCNSKKRLHKGRRRSYVQGKSRTHHYGKDSYNTQLVKNSSFPHPSHAEYYMSLPNFPPFYGSSSGNKCGLLLDMRVLTIPPRSRKNHALQLCSTLAT